MKIFNSRTPIAYFPLPGTYALIAANVIVYLACCIASSSPEPSSAVLYKFGALYAGALDQQEYWRTISAIFLHANPLHIFFNMICLASWGGVVERRVGTTYFLIIYLFSGVAASVASLLLHPAAYIGVGASGAVFGLMGALFALWLLQRIDVQAQFFVVNLGLNLVLMAGPIRVDWQAHLGGLAAGLVICAILDPAEWLLSKILVHKFPEPIKFSFTLSSVVISIMTIHCFNIDTQNLGNKASDISITVVLLVVFLKTIDVMLGIKKGLAVLVVLFGLAYAAVPYCAIVLQPAVFTQACQFAGTRFGLPTYPCSDTRVLATALGGVSVLLAFILMWGELRRGLKDTGVLDGIFRAARRRAGSL